MLGISLQSGAVVLLSGNGSNNIFRHQRSLLARGGGGSKFKKFCGCGRPFWMVPKPMMHLISVVGRALCDAVEHCVVVEEGEGPVIAQVALSLTKSKYCNHKYKLLVLYTEQKLICLSMKAHKTFFVTFLSNRP